ncbi:MAG: prepilin-type N-terminal cleavage/methylation domain-containing protein [Planctomycetota bacterium]
MRASFTLVETLVALALGALLAAAVQGLIVHAQRTSGQVCVDQAERARRGLPFDLLGQDLAQQPAPALVLHDGTLGLTTTAALQSPRLAARHLVNVVYATRAAENEPCLVRSEAELNSAPGPGVALTGGLAAAEFAVFDGRHWQTAWAADPPRRARGLRLRLTWRDGQTLERVFGLGPFEWRRHDE